jgi:(p)ppGpp synthase/HD superfamily hydrolase
MLNDIARIAQAYDFAARRHAQQRRKGARQEPYLNHLTTVARLVAESLDEADPNLIIAAVLHDTLEDTEATAGELMELFGSDVAHLVLEVTDNKALVKEERKQRQIDHAPHLTARAKRIKLADKIANLWDLAGSPPADWDLQRRQEYFDWAARVVNGLRGTCPGLELLFDEACRLRPRA